MWYLDAFLVFDRSSHQRCSVKKGVLRNFTKFTGKHLCQSLFFSKVAGLMPATLLKKRLWHSRFPVNFAKFLRIHFLQNTSGRLLLCQVNLNVKISAKSYYSIRKLFPNNNKTPFFPPLFISKRAYHKFQRQSWRRQSLFGISKPYDKL